MNMVNNMFSMFDPSTYFMATGWIVLALPVAMMKSPSMKKSAKLASLTKMVGSFVQKEITQLTAKFLKLNPPMFLALFMVVLLTNLIAIFPYNFTPTAHISVSFTLSLTMWMSTMVFGWKHQFKNMMAHLTPLGTPNALMNFMVLIEVVSSMIRPITLSIRLSANMVAGHLLMALLSSFSMGTKLNLITSTAPMVCLISLEMAVAMVQAYVLMTLMILYQNETT